MKKLAYLLATAALVACSGNPNGYTIKGSIAGATDGEMVYLQKVEGRQYVALGHHCQRSIYLRGRTSACCLSLPYLRRHRIGKRHRRRILP